MLRSCSTLVRLSEQKEICALRMQPSWGPPLPKLYAACIDIM